MFHRLHQQPRQRKLREASPGTDRAPSKPQRKADGHPRDREAAREGADDAGARRHSGAQLGGEEPLVRQVQPAVPTDVCGNAGERRGVDGSRGAEREDDFGRDSAAQFAPPRAEREAGGAWGFAGAQIEVQFRAEVFSAAGGHLSCGQNARTDPPCFEWCFPLRTAATGRRSRSIIRRGVVSKERDFVSVTSSPNARSTYSQFVLSRSP